jgi:tetratricopeptide (TPR) repeat protein
MRMIMTWVAIATCLLVEPGRARADSSNPLAKPADRVAREHLVRGNRLYNTRAFEEAITEYKTGALADPTPVFDYNLGQAYRQLGKYRDALWHYERFLKYGNPTGELLDAVNRFMSEMRAQLANRAPTMHPTGPAATEGAAFRPAGPSSSPARLVDRNEPVGRIERANYAGAPNWLGWTTLGTGVVALGTSGVLLLSASSLKDRANAEPDVRERNALHDRAGTRNLIGATAGIGGVALTATAVVMLVVRSRSQANATSWSMGISGSGLTVLGSF